MGMDLYKSSPAARAVWDSADAHLISAYGFSIVEIVRENPKKKTIHFGGIKGQAIRERYMEMTYDTTDKDGNIKSLPLFADISVRTLHHTFTHPKELLFTTQFAQIALVVTSPQPLKTRVRKVWSSRAPPSLATHWANSLPSLLLQISCQIPLWLTSCFIAV